MLLGSTELPRISCAAHKLNLVVRSAITRHKRICDDLHEINGYISKIRSSYNLSREFINAKCRLRLENATRWGSQYLCLEALEHVNKLYFQQKILKVYIKLSHKIKACEKLTKKAHETSYIYSTFRLRGVQLITT